MKTSWVPVVVVLVLSSGSFFVNGQPAPSPSSKPCAFTVREYCSGDVNTTQGFNRCCQGISMVAKDDLRCLCLLFKTSNLTKAEALVLLNGCGVEKGENPCPGLTDDPPVEPPTDSNSPPAPPPPTKSFYTPKSPLPSLPPPPLVAPPSQKDPKATEKKPIGVIVGSVIGSLVFIIFVIVGFIFHGRKKKKKTPNETPAEGGEIPNPPLDGPSPLPDIYVGSSSHSFTYQELVNSTDGFSMQNLIGHGGFGFVYKGVLPNGTKVAVKKLEAGSHQGDREFRAEVDIISRVHHKHLVSLVGYCIAEDQKLVVYDYIPNKTLEFHLHERQTTILDWFARLKIAIGTAKGLAYLHEDCHPKIIHRDIKTANILIDDNYDAKVADFGLAKFNVDNNSHISTRIVGTFGYLAPEYASTGHVTDKSDVFSFGVVLIELITGFKALDKARVAEHGSAVAWATPLLLRAVEDGIYDDLVDQRLQDNYDTDEMSRVVSCAVACIRHTAKLRPTMSKVARILEGEVSVKDLNQGMKLGHGSSTGSSDYGSDHAVHRKKFTKGTHTSAEYTSSEYSAVTNESITNSRVIGNEESQ